MINHELSRGWKAWAEEVQAKLAAVLLLRKGLRFLLNREQARGVACWLRHVNTDEKQITAKANKDFLSSRFLRWRRGDGNGPLRAVGRPDPLNVGDGADTFQGAVVPVEDRQPQLARQRRRHTVCPAQRP